jgi:hypothetical protein
MTACRESFLRKLSPTLVYDTATKNRSGYDSVAEMSGNL